jgi:hypothetical protein
LILSQHAVKHSLELPQTLRNGIVLDGQIGLQFLPRVFILKLPSALE